MSDRPSYSLALSDQEIERYRFMAQMARSVEADLWARAGIGEGAAIADVGCGPGLVLVEMADIVGPSGFVRGVDRDVAAVATAQRLIDEGGLGNAGVSEGEAWATGLPPASFDVVNIRHVLAHNTAEDRQHILEHAFDLLVPGGAIYLVDVDLTGGRIDPADEDLQDLLDRYAVHLSDTGREPAIGPKLGSAVRAAGFDQVERSAIVQMPPPQALTTIRPPAWAAREAMRASGHATDADIERWDRALSSFAATAIELDRALFMPVYLVIGRRPAS
ncbi:MAG: methyltransferase domain-containing protein [Acidimicrobiales bacterium]